MERTEILERIWTAKKEKRRAGGFIKGERRNGLLILEVSDDGPGAEMNELSPYSLFCKRIAGIVNANPSGTVNAQVASTVTTSLAKRTESTVNMLKPTSG
jgi:hypothetical protein